MIGCHTIGAKSIAVCRWILKIGVCTNHPKFGQVIVLIRSWSISWRWTIFWHMTDITGRLDVGGHVVCGRPDKPRPAILGCFASGTSCFGRTGWRPFCFCFRRNIRMLRPRRGTRIFVARRRVRFRRTRRLRRLLRAYRLSVRDHRIWKCCNRWNNTSLSSLYQERTGHSIWNSSLESDLSRRIRTERENTTDMCCYKQKHERKRFWRSNF